MLSPQHHKLQHDVSEPRARTPDIPLIDTTPAVHEALRDHALGGEEADVFQGLVEHVGDDLEDGQDVQGSVFGWVFEGLGGPGPERDEAEEAEGVAGFGEEGGEGEEGRSRRRRGGRRGRWRLFLLLETREETETGLEGDPRR